MSAASLPLSHEEGGNQSVIVVRHSYISARDRQSRRGGGQPKVAAVGRALAHLKYIQHRPGEDRRVANANAYTTAVYQNLSQKDQQLDNRINNLTSNSYRGIACAIALVSAPRPAPGKTGIGFGTGYYMGNAATALTMAHSSRGGHWQSSFGVATSVTGNSGANIAGGGGVLYQF